MKKITQNLSKSFWRSGLLAMAFLFSLTINSQEVGQEYLVNPGINTATGPNSTTPETGVDGGGNFPANLGGWGAGTGGAFASASTANGDCHSADRMFKFFKVGGADGQYVNQTITALPAGNYNWSFFTQWGDAGHSSGPTGTAPGNLPSWSAEGDNQPKFTILVQDAEGAWVADQQNVTTEPTTAFTWVEDSGTWTNTETRDVRIKFAKNGGTAANGGSNTDKLMYIDDASLTYASALEATSDCEYTISLTDTYGDSWNGASVELLANGVSLGSFTNTSAAAANEAQLFTFGINEGDVITSVWTSGSYDSETAYSISDSFGNIVTSVADGDDMTQFTATCVEDVAPSLEVTATTDGDSATFSFDISNFTVGAAAGEGDGHIHWSIFSASDLNTPIYENVMVYSTDDLTLSPLPNGDHVIVFSLVDPNHQPLDPAVESTVEFSTFDGNIACGETFTTCYDSDTSGAYSNDAPLSLFSSTGNAGDVVSVTFGGGTESGYDYVIVTNGAGVQIGDPLTGDLNGVVVTSDDGTINVGLNADSSWSCVSGQSGFDSLSATVSCVTPTYDVTFSVNTANITVGANGMYAGGGVLGDATAYAMSDDDGDGTWTVTISMNQGTSGNYTFLNSPNDGGDWGAKEDLAGQSCADANNYNDRILAEVTADTTLLHCFASCETDGTCGSPAEPVLMPVDHENENVVYAWNDFGGAATTVIANPDASGVNTSATVAQSIKTAGSETWAGTFLVLDEQLDLSTITTLAVDVWTPDGGELVNLKVENAADGNINIEINQPTTVAAGWETLYYDLSGGDLSQVYDKLVFFFDFNVSGDDTAYYFDNIRLEAASTAGIDPGCNDFDDGAGDWTVVDAGGLDSDWLIEDTLANGDSGQSFGHGYLPSTAAYNDWLVSPAYNTTGLSAPTLSYYEYLNWSADATAHNVYYSLDYAGDATTATWVLLNDVIGTDAEDAWVQRTFALPSAENVVVSFQYNSTYGADWNIDDVCVQEDTLSTVDATVLDMRIYPNPSNGSYVTIQTPVNGVKYVEVFDITGKRLMNTSLSADTLDVSSISSGMYLVKVTIEGQSKTSKLIIR
ncbi:T9SS type A sorting domain-containing protein [Flavobacteriaceae bacterium]|nr:T9SS type A sorting domain-containing protein [Flavobacteriaceae bacterium]